MSVIEDCDNGSILSPNPLEGCSMGCNLVFAKVAVVLEALATLMTLNGLAWQVHVLQVLFKVEGCAESLETDCTSLRLHGSTYALGRSTNICNNQTNLF